MKNPACIWCFGSDLLAEFYSGALVTKGVFAVFFGLLFMLSPSMLPWTVGVLLVVNGGFALGAAFSLPAGRVFAVCYSLLAVLMGIFIMSNPITWGLAAVWVLGIWLVVSAVVQFVRALLHRDDGVSIFMQILSAIFSAMAGVLFFFHPFFSGLVLNFIVCGALLALGFFFVGAGLFLRRPAAEAKKLTPPEAEAPAVSEAGQ